MYGFINVQKREGIVLATIFENRSAEWEQELVGEMCCFIEPVSYTHLDVYKRQLQSGCQ